MQLSFNGLDRPKRAARNLKTAFETKLSVAQELIALIAGYRDWHELERSGQSSVPSSLDRELGGRECEQRRMLLIMRLQKSAGVSFMEAARGILSAQLLHQNIEDPDRALRNDGELRVGQTVLVDGRSKGIVLSAVRGIRVLDAEGAVALRGREEVQPIPPDRSFSLPARMWVAYGVWDEPDGAQVLYSRNYYPLWRISKGGMVEEADPTEWINFSAQRWFWNDANRPWQSKVRLAEEVERLRSYGVVGEPLLKWAVLPTLFGRDVQAMSDAMLQLKETKPWVQHSR